MTDPRLTELLADALAPLVEFVADNYAVIERAADAYSDWGIGWLEATANGYVETDHNIG